MILGSWDTQTKPLLKSLTEEIDIKYNHHDAPQRPSGVMAWGISEPDELLGEVAQRNVLRQTFRLVGASVQR